MYARQLRDQKEQELKEVMDTIIKHWESHKKPYAYNVKNIKDSDYHKILLANIMWVSDGAKSCTCYHNDRSKSRFILMTKLLQAVNLISQIETCNLIMEGYSTKFKKEKKVTGLRALLIDMAD